MCNLHFTHSFMKNHPVKCPFMPSARHSSRKGTLSKPRVLEHLLCLMQLWTLFRLPSKAVHSFTLKWFCEILCKIHITQLLLILPLPNAECTNSFVVEQPFSKLLTLAAASSKNYNLGHLNENLQSSLLTSVGWKVQGQWICFCIFLEV